MVKLCALCGENDATTNDHIPPRGIYPKPRDNDMNLNTVPACNSCNNGAKVEDEEFKVLIGISTGEFHNNPGMVIDSIAGTVGNNQKIANQIFSTKKNTHAKLNGSALEPAVEITFDGEKYQKVISRIIRGLYWMQKGKALNTGSKISIFPGNNVSHEFASSMMELMDCLEANSLNKDTFVYKFIFLDAHESIWGMQFFKKHTVFGCVQETKI
jgi:hypothetical protein